MKIDRVKVHSKYDGHCGYCVAVDYKMIEIKPFNGQFYFEQILNQNK